MHKFHGFVATMLTTCTVIIVAHAIPKCGSVHVNLNNYSNPFPAGEGLLNHTQGGRSYLGKGWGGGGLHADIMHF